MTRAIFWEQTSAARSPILTIKSSLVLPSALGVNTSLGKEKGFLFLSADLDRATSFSVRGDLGANGSGKVSGSVLTRTFHGITYKGFFKSVSGTTDPSVNHLIIVEDKPSIARATAVIRIEMNTTSRDYLDQLVYIIFFFLAAMELKFLQRWQAM
jgi:hypothetical protein